MAIIVDGDASLKVDTQYLTLNLRPGSLYQFIGELQIEPNTEVRRLISTYTETFLASKSMIIHLFVVLVGVQLWNLDLYVGGGCEDSTTPVA